MTLILDADGAFAWSRGPTTAPVLSIAARRLTVEPPPSVGSAPQEPPAGPHSDLPVEGGPSDPLEFPDPTTSTWQIDPAAWAITQFATAQLHDRRRTERLVTLAAQIDRARPQFQSAPGGRDVGRPQSCLPPAGPP